jgi:hypothetical protein
MWDQLSADAVYAIQPLSKMKLVVAVVVDNGADFQLEGEATVNPPTQSPYTLHTESGPDWFVRPSQIATGITLVKRGQGGRTSLCVTLF